MPTNNEQILEQLRKAREKKIKPPYKGIRKVGLKKQAEQKAQKELRGESDTLMENWFKNRRKEMVGVCQCGCARPSSKKEDASFRSSAAHIFPKKIFLSIMYHPLNYVERNFWNGCHTNMDDRSMDLWVNFADWDDIKEKFHVLAPLLTDEERAHKFYRHLEKLIVTI